MDSFIQDLKFAVRALRKSPLLTLVAALSLGIGIGANAAIFSAVDIFMIRPLPYRESERLVFAWTTNQERGWNSVSNAMPDFLDWREASRTMDLAAFRGTGVNLSAEGTPERLSGYQASWNFLQVLGERPVMGRSFAPEDERAGGAQVVLLGHGVWERLFGSQPDIVGQTVLLDGAPYTIVGILPPRFQFGYNQPEVILPLGITGEEARNSHYLWTLGRIRDGFDLDQARAEIDQLERRIAQAYPETSVGNGARLETIRDAWFDEGFRSGSMISTVAVLLVLLIACANVANLLLARSTYRRKEIAVRGALGAQRGRLIRQLMTESLLLAILGGVLGIGLGVLGVRGLVSIMPSDFLLVDQIRLSGRVLAFTAGITLLSGLLFGLAPALQTAASEIRSSLSEGSRGSTGARGGRLRKGLVVTEVALAMVLLVSSALLVESFLRIRSVDMGIDPDPVLTMEMILPEARYGTDQEIVAFEQNLLGRIEAIPGVQRAGLAQTLPMRGNDATFYSIPDQDPPEEGRQPVVSFRIVTPGYFEAMGIPLVAGRFLEDTDDDAAVPVVLVNEAFAAQHWPEEDPIGKRVEFVSGEKEIVGVVGNVRAFGPNDEAPIMVYLPAYAGPSRHLALTVKVAGDPISHVAPVRETILSVDPDQPAYNVQTLTEVLKDEMGGETIMAKIMGVLAVVALSLAVVGVYGVMAYTVSRRVQEVGIRMALGADSGAVLTLMLRQGGALAALGVGIGFIASLGVTRGLSFFLYGVSPFHLPTFLAVALILFGAGFTATLLPARKASRVDPIVALRWE
jgi:putative ABC transport system permease protein